VKQETTQIERIIDVDAIPLPQLEPVSATLVEEEEKSLMIANMEI